MSTRKEKIEELMETLAILRRNIVSRGIESPKIPHITSSQWGVLMLIEQRGEVSVKDVANALQMSSSAATQLVDVLVKSRYVARTKHSEDRRLVSLTLSKKTETQMAKMKGQRLEKFLKMFGPLTDKELEHYLALNKKMIEKPPTNKNQ